jgi:hypothetical protein
VDNLPFIANGNALFVDLYAASRQPTALGVHFPRCLIHSSGCLRSFSIDVGCDDSSLESLAPGLNPILGLTFCIRKLRNDSKFALRPACPERTAHKKDIVADAIGGFTHHRLLFCRKSKKAGLGPTSSSHSATKLPVHPWSAFGE